MRKTKIVCTLGPATNDPAILRALMENGMNVARLNFSHGTHAEHQKSTDNSQGCKYVEEAKERGLRLVYFFPKALKKIFHSLQLLKTTVNVLPLPISLST